MLIGVLLAATLFWLIDWHEVLFQIKQASIYIVLAAGALQFVTVILINLQWYMTAACIGKRVSFAKVVHINMVGTFVESITPALKTGGEAVKIMLCRSHADLSGVFSVALVGLQKLLSMVSFVLINILGIAVYLAKYRGDKTIDALFLMGLCFLLLVLLFATLILFFPKTILFVMSKMPIKQPVKARIQAFFNSLLDITRFAAKQTKKVGLLFFISLTIWGLYIFKAFMIAYLLNMHIHYVQLWLAVLFSYLVAMIPMLPGGIGSFEAAMVLFLTHYGISPEQSMSLALLIRVITFWLVFMVSALYISMYYIFKKPNYTRLNLVPALKSYLKKGRSAYE